MTGRLKEADERTKRELADKCQENGWLRRGGYPWQDDPYLEEYPYEFAKAGSVEELRGFFAHGNWALRQGIVYEDSRLRAAGRRRRRVVDAEAHRLRLARLRELVLRPHRAGAREVLTCDRVHASRNSRAVQAPRVHGGGSEHRGCRQTRTRFHPATEQNGDDAHARRAGGASLNTLTKAGSPRLLCFRKATGTVCPTKRKGQEA